MNTIRNGLLAVLGLSLAATVCAGPVASTSPMEPPPPQGGPYLTLAGGALWLEDAGAYGASLDFDTGFSILGALGYSFGNGLAVEIESGYMEVDSAELSYRGFHADVNGEFRQVPVLANAVYTLDLTDRLSFYIGGGAGVVWSDAQVDEVAGVDVSGFGDVDDDWNFAAQAKAGLSFEVSDTASLNVGYRYFYGKDALGGVDDAQGSILEGGFTIRF